MNHSNIGTPSSQSGSIGVHTLGSWRPAMYFSSWRWRSRTSPEKLVGLALVLVLHGAVLYGLFKYQIISMPDATLIVSFVNPEPPAEPHKPDPPKPVPPKHVEPPKPQLIVAEATVLKPDEPVAPLPPPQPVIEAPPVPPLPVMLTNDLAVSCPERAPPEYPLIAKRQNEQGKVVLRVELNEDGRIGSVFVKTSSGSSRLDQAALNAVRGWRCNPAMRNGIAVRAVALQPFNFTLVEN